MCCLELLDVYRAVVDRRLTGDGRIDARAAGADALDRQQVGTIAQLQAGGDQNIAVAGGELWGSNVSIRCKQERINVSLPDGKGMRGVTGQAPGGGGPRRRRTIAGGLEADGGTVHRRRNHRRSRADIVDLEDVPVAHPLTILPKVTETADGLEDVAVGCVALVVNTL